VDGHPERYREYSGRVYEIFGRFSPRVEMASIDEAYLNLTGCERLLGPPLQAAHRLHETVARETRLPCSIGIGATKLVAKVASDQAKPNGVLWVLPGTEQAFLAPLAIRKIPGIGPVMERDLHERGIRTVRDLAAAEAGSLADEFGLWGTALAGKARGEDAGGWFDVPVGGREDPKSVSHETTFHEDTTDVRLLEATLVKLSEMVARRLREYGLYGRTIALKLRYSDFSTITRARTLDAATQLDKDIVDAALDLFRRNWAGSAAGRPRAVRLLGVEASNLSRDAGQMPLLDRDLKEKWRRALTAVDKLRDRYGESSVELAGGLRGSWQERVHENPAGLPGKKRRD
jgi:DNA polymerase IV